MEISLNGSNAGHFLDQLETLWWSWWQLPGPTGVDCCGLREKRPAPLGLPTAPLHRTGLGTSSIFGGLFLLFVMFLFLLRWKIVIIWKRLVTCSSSCRSPFYDFCGGCVGVGVIGYAKGVGRFFVKDYLIFAEVVFNRSTFDFVQLVANFWLRSASSAQIEFKMRWHL